MTVEEAREREEAARRSALLAGVRLGLAAALREVTLMKLECGSRSPAMILAEGARNRIRALDAEEVARDG